MKTNTEPSLLSAFSVCQSERPFLCRMRLSNALESQPKILYQNVPALLVQPH